LKGRCIICGLVGIFGDISLAHKRMFLDLWIVNTLRGDDSSGIALINKQNFVRVMKEIGTPYEIVYTKSFSKAYQKDQICILGHNRFATIGDVTKELAHPFHKGSVVGIHNGTLRNRTFLPNKDKFESDSEHLFASIDSDGLHKTWKNVDGAAAIVWWDKRNLTLNMIKNSERSLFFAFLGGDELKKGVVWASEAWMITSLAQRKNVNIGTIWRPIINTHYTFSYNRKGKTVSYISEKVAPFSWIKQNKNNHISHTPYTWPHAGKTYNQVTQKWEDEDPTSYYRSHIDRKSELNLGICDGSLTDKTITETEFFSTYDTCAYCGEYFDESAFVTAVIIDTRTALCGTCASEE